jgi:hypothetical protein
MRVTAFHDSEGNIVGLVVAPPDSMPVQVQSQAHPGLQMTEIEPPEEVTLDPDSPQLHEEMDKLRETFRVEIPSGKGRLTKKS